MQELGLNTIRVCMFFFFFTSLRQGLGLSLGIDTIDNSKDHSECMKMLSDAGIYLILVSTIWSCRGKSLYILLLLLS